MAVFRLTTTDRSFREAVAVDAPSSDVIIDPGLRPTVRLIGVTGEGRSVQHTTSPEAMILAGAAVWADWDGGAIVGSADGRAKGGVTGIRLSPFGGAGTWEVLA